MLLPHLDLEETTIYLHITERHLSATELHSMHSHLPHRRSGPGRFPLRLCRSCSACAKPPGFAANNIVDLRILESI
jgi:hypothetical protein